MFGQRLAITAYPMRLPSRFNIEVSSMPSESLGLCPGSRYAIPRGLLDPATGT
jgi:hypothetical protein